MLATRTLTIDLVLSHLFSSIDYLVLLGSPIVVLLRLLLFFILLIYDLNGCYVRFVTLIILELNIIAQQEVHEAVFFFLWQFTEDKCLWCRGLNLLHWWVWRFVPRLLLLARGFLLLLGYALSEGTFAIAHYILLLFN